MHNVSKNPTSIPMGVEINPGFVFVNSGSTTGMIQLRLRFAPSPAFQLLDCCNKFSIRFMNDRGLTEDMPHLFLQERESGIVKVMLSIGLGDWKSYVARPNEIDESSICPTVLQADDANKKRFAEFCSHLKEHRSLGTVSVYCVRTKRRWVRSWHIIRGKDIIKENTLFANEPVGIDSESIKNLSSYSNEWDDIQPRQVIELLQDAERKFESFFSQGPAGARCARIEAHLHKDDRPVETWREFWNYTWYGVLDEDSEHGEWESVLPARYVLDFILRSSQLDLQMREFSKKAAELNHNRRLWNRIDKDGEESKDLFKSMEKQRQELIAKNIEIQKTGDRVTQILKNCVTQAFVITGKSRDFEAITFEI